MKKFLLLAFLAGTLQLVHAQDLKKVQTAYLITKMEDAKTEIDKVMADPKQNTKTEAIYWKAKVYSAIYKDTRLREKYPNAMKDADIAFRAYIAADPTFAETKAKGAEGFFDMYATSYATGVKMFNDKKWDDAVNNFIIAVDYSDLIFQNK
jgi:hypothetical protein